METDPTVQAFARAALPSCGVGQVLKSNGTIFSCVADVDTFLVSDGTSLVTSGSKHIVTGINIDNVLVTTTIAGIMSADPAYPSAVYWGPTQTHFAQLAAGAHTIKVVYRTPAGGVSDPLSGEDWEDRRFQVMILGFQ